MPIGLAAGLGLAGASALGGFLSNRSQEIKRNPADTGLAQLLRGEFTQRLRSPIPLEGYTAGGIQNINNTFSPIRQLLDANLTRRGLSTSPVAAAAENDLELQRGASLAQFLNQVPLLERDLRSQDFQTISNFLNSAPTQVLPGNRAGGAIVSPATTLAYLIGTGELNLGGNAGIGNGSGVTNALLR